MHPQLTAFAADDHLQTLRHAHRGIRTTRGPGSRLWRYLRDAREVEQPAIHRTGGGAC